MSRLDPHNESYILNIQKQTGLKQTINTWTKSTTRTQIAGTNNEEKTDNTPYLYVKNKMKFRKKICFQLFHNLDCLYSNAEQLQRDDQFLYYNISCQECLSYSSKNIYLCYSFEVRKPTKKKNNPQNYKAQLACLIFSESVLMTTVKAILRGKG